MSPPLIELTDLSFGYPNHPVFSQVNLHLNEGERLALVGGNGSGKSTLLQLIVGLQSATEGSISAFGQACREEKDFRPVRAKVGLLFQDSDDQLFCPSVLEDVAFGPLNLGKTEQQAREIAESTLQRLGLEQFAHRITHKLSGGEKRLVALATVLAMEPQVLLLDEPTNGLDEDAEQRLIALLESLPQAMILVSHDRRLIERLATRAVLMQNNTLVDAVMHSHPHQHTHSHLHIHVAKNEVAHQHDKGVPDHADHHLQD
ncbi:MAG: energy-coupling factor ABC transporter ATP-binding protein [Motiliproteus sp.]|nr:energy-coupling factor ABC transporter ATP-binding protein [Motiliproteus sp.]MCW9051451.1 energy-coupling factor ABC transporter ATP-binding protein [Motiliproteus sp.]